MQARHHNKIADDSSVRAGQLTSSAHRRSFACPSAKNRTGRAWSTPRTRAQVLRSRNSQQISLRWSQAQPR
eukprot:600997-Rhodomonas_salina.7